MREQGGGESGEKRDDFFFDAEKKRIRANGNFSDENKPTGVPGVRSLAIVLKHPHSPDVPGGSLITLLPRLPSLLITFVRHRLLFRLS